MKRLKARYGCPVELALEFVGGKWKAVILAWLKESPHRYAELRARLPGVSDKVLTEKLKDLELLGLVEKAAINGSGSAVVYRLTERGEGLRPVLDALYAWGGALGPELSVIIGPGDSPTKKPAGEPAG
ncbi:winged helix-turn-helix transcriptional regulator [Phenylobacterium montanum]|uniref:Helix-turn-helix transcriptional regulator n=1 Tax=Phenylobacterium montanum TaxID=2823693 RepID=A0A975IUE4_9CAUL|nr:helix-turn-helix domain-containing protein [Caulobacter sp. S6]QUD86161.1 helix-turn-helix transcriptional regulator [Caulobacter sp. S6]